MVVSEQPRFRDEIHRDDIVEIRPADIPNLVGAARVLFPCILAEAAIQRVERRAILVQHLIVATVAVEEVEPGARIEQIVPRAAKHPVQPGIFQRVETAAVIVEEIARRIDEHSELPAQPRVPRPRKELVRSRAADQIVVPLAAKEHVIVRWLSIAGVAEDSIVPAEARQPIAARAAIQPVAARRARERVVTRPARQHADEVIAAIHQPRNVHRVGARAEAKRVVAVEAIDAELFEQRLPGIVAPDGGQCDTVVINPQVATGNRARLADENSVVPCGPVDLENIRREIIGSETAGLILAVAIEAILIRRHHAEEQEVDPAAAEELIVPGLAIEQIRIRTTVENVIVAAAEQVILAEAADQRVASTGRCGTRIQSIERTSQPVATQIVVAVAAV